MDHSAAGRRHSTVDSNDKWFHVSKTNCLICFDVWINSYQMIYVKELFVLVINVKWLGFEFPPWFGTMYVYFMVWRDFCYVFDCVAVGHCLDLDSVVMFWSPFYYDFIISFWDFFVELYALHGFDVCHEDNIAFHFTIDGKWSGVIHCKMDNWHLFHFMGYIFAWEKSHFALSTFSCKFKFRQIRMHHKFWSADPRVVFIPLTSKSYFEINKNTYQNRKNFIPT